MALALAVMGIGLVAVVVWFVFAVGHDMEHTRADERRDAEQAWRRD